MGLFVKDQPTNELDRVDHELTDNLKILTTRHEKFCKRVIGVLPSQFSSMDMVRMTLVFFAVSTLDVLKTLDQVLTEDERAEIVEWIHRLQVSQGDDEKQQAGHGFRGSTTFRTSEEHRRQTCSSKGCHLTWTDGGHLAMTYAALATLLILGDDLSRVNKPSIVRGIRTLQLPDGSFKASVEAAENDMRFVFCAAAICYMINDWSGMDVDRAADFVRNSQRYDGGIAQGPGLESHGGSTYCGLAALKLMGRLDSHLPASLRDRARRWCLFRLHQGFQGRPNKPDDTCYTFWIGASLKMLCVDDQDEALMAAIVSRCHAFVLNTQDAVVGGLAKWPVETTPDPLHTYLGLSGLSLFGYDADGVSLRKVFAPLNITERAHRHLLSLHQGGPLIPS